MSTHDKVIANDTMPNVRADINLALAAIASQEAGTADPSAMLAYERQARTDTGLMRRRNAANSGWVIDGTLAEVFLIARSSNTILGTANHGTTIKATSTFTQTLTAAATLGDGWECGYVNAGTGIITLDPNSTETIDGSTTITLNPGDSCIIACDGSNFYTVGRAGGRTMPAFSVNRATVAQGIPDNTWTKVQFTTEVFDTNGNFDNATNYRFTPTVAGKYFMEFTAQYASELDQKTHAIAIYKNGVVYKSKQWASSGTGGQGEGISAVIDFNGTSDYVEFYVYQNQGGAVNLDGAIASTCASGIRIA